MDKGLTKAYAIKLYQHTNYGYTVKTNLTLADIDYYFPTEPQKRGFYARCGEAKEGESRNAVYEIRPTRNAVQEYTTPWGTEEWLTRAACRFAAENEGVEFTPFMDSRESAHWPSLLKKDAPGALEIKAAMEVCSTCPVAKECFTKSIEHRRANQFGESGIWAGSMESSRLSHLKMRGRRDIEEFRAKLGNRDAATTTVCTRCLRPAAGKIHLNGHFDRSCPGPVTALSAVDVATAIYLPQEENELLTEEVS